MQLDCDVAVVGAGPAGSRTARNLARAGLRVRLLEEHRRVGVPSHCSGLISPRTLREAEIGEDAIIHRITGAFVHTAAGGEVAVGGDKTRAVAIDRVRWDETLAEQAQAAGADLVRARLTNVERENGHVRLHTQTDGRDSAFTARAGIGSSNAVKPIACYRRLTQLFPRLFDGIESCRLYGGTIPLDFAPRSYAGNVLLVGDAAGQVKPFSGGGIYTGLVAARHASA